MAKTSTGGRMAARLCLSGGDVGSATACHVDPRPPADDAGQHVRKPEYSPDGDVLKGWGEFFEKR
jgi:hypothetical protein